MKRLIGFWELGREFIWNDEGRMTKYELNRVSTLIIFVDTDSKTIFWPDNQQIYLCDTPTKLRGTLCQKFYRKYWLRHKSANQSIHLDNIH